MIDEREQRLENARANGRDRARCNPAVCQLETSCRLRFQAKKKQTIGIVEGLPARILRRPSQALAADRSRHALFVEARCAAGLTGRPQL